MYKKIFHGALLESVLLNLINENSERGLHGYAIFSSLNKKFGIRLGPSTIYPELRNLEKQELVASSWDFTLGRARRQYRITRKGQYLMTEYNAELKSIIPASRQMELRAKP
jgi:DNA-binding PadR family transcriptional regulator